MFEDGYRFVAEGQHASAHRQRQMLDAKTPGRAQGGGRS
jgi:hypothetical protein